MIGSKSAAAALLILALFSPSARPQGPTAADPSGFTVAGKATASARPNRLEIEVEISAASELTADAIVKYRDARKRLRDAFAALKLANVSVEERALGVAQKRQAFNPYFGGMPSPTKAKVEVELTRRLVITCTKIRDLDEEAMLTLVARLLDVAQDAGGKVGPQVEFNPYSYRSGGQSAGLVKFILDDLDAIRDTTYAAAMADAKARARRLASLGGVDLGPVVGIREVAVPGEKTPKNQPVYIYDFSQGEGEEETASRRVESSKFQEIPVRVELLVRFEVAPVPKPQGGAR